MEIVTNAIAVIPARGGSKGIPRKNLIPIRGKPLICWSIEAARASNLVAEVVVSTDDLEIADISSQAGATVVMRPDELSTDITSSEDALIHALNQLQKLPDLIVFMQCTSPLTTSADIDNCIQKLIESGADSAFTATESHRFLWINEDAASGINHDAATRKRRQDLKKEYAENGAVYVMRTAGFLQAHHRFFGKIAISEMPAMRSWEIDSYDDIHMVETLFALRNRTTLLSECVQAVVFDFDGVMTDNAVYVSEEGKESVRCCRGDGWGINRMNKSGFRLAVMSSEENPVVQARCAKLKIECFYQLGDSKIDRFTRWCREHGFEMKHVVYVGNDENDIACLETAGFGVVPADAHDSAKHVADYVLSSRGGNGAVRELCDLILEQTKDEL